MTFWATIILSQSVPLSHWSPKTQRIGVLVVTRASLRISTCLAHILHSLPLQSSLRISTCLAHILHSLPLQSSPICSFCCFTLCLETGDTNTLPIPNVRGDSSSSSYSSLVYPLSCITYEFLGILETSPPTSTILSATLIDDGGTYETGAALREANSS